MRRPATLDDALDLVRRSTLVPAEAVDSFAARLRPAEAARPPAGVLALMADRGLLTPYQASEIAAGRWRGFDLGPYRILDRLGRGGMGHVYLCEHTRMARRVAVKVLSHGLSTDPTARRRFVREAQAVAALDHPNVVRVFDVEVDADPPFIVMEFVDGLSFQAAVVRHGPYAPGEAATCGVQAARGLQGIADAGLTHRDVKPANLILDRSGVVKVLDLGIARFDGQDSTTLDGAKLVLGTLDYLAPEQALDSSAVDARADLYSLGATLYYLLAGHPPFPDGDVGQKVARKQSADPPPLDRVRPDVPAGLAAVVHKLLARDPADRPATPADAAALLLPWADPPADFPGRLFAPLLPAAGPAAGPATAGRESEHTSACLTLRIVKHPKPATAVFPGPAADPGPATDALAFAPAAGIGLSTGLMDPGPATAAYDCPPTEPTSVSATDLAAPHVPAPGDPADAIPEGVPVADEVDFFPAPHEFASPAAIVARPAERPPSRSGRIVAAVAAAAFAAVVAGWAVAAVWAATAAKP